ncbi:unnamed protein product [Ilex paraguariensis]|uniref:Uncharacterized protein n=1 Tax=Ilex paraguariensis TaxID=185542 RepID=A0ABC8S4T7_9AQUA
MVLNSADYSAGPSTSTTEPQSVLVEAPTWELNSTLHGRHRDDFSAGPSTKTTGPHPVLVGPPTWELNSPSVVATVDFSLDDEFWSAVGSPFPDLSFSSLWISDDFSAGPSTDTTGPQPELAEPPHRELNLPSMAATRDLSLDDKFRSAAGSPCPDGTTGAPPVPVEPPTRFRLGKGMTVEVNKHLGLSEPYFFVVEFNHTPQGESINWRNVEINYPDIDKAFKDQESYVTLFERQVMVIGQKLAYLRPDAKDFSVLKKIRLTPSLIFILELDDASFSRGNSI